MVPLAMCTFVPGVCVPVKLPVLSNIESKDTASAERSSEQKNRSGVKFTPDLFFCYHS